MMPATKESWNDFAAIIQKNGILLLQLIFGAMVKALT